MRVKITIDCEDCEEIVSHLQKMIEEVIEVTENGKNDILKKTVISDDNCYGHHIMTINP